MPKSEQRKSVDVLFIGNSFTARNDLPDMIAKMAIACGKSMQHDLIFAGGASLRAHWNAGRALKHIQASKYDYVVLQEQSTLPVKNAIRMHENIRLFDSAIDKAGAKAVLYLTWARAHLPETQKVITDAYTTIGKELDAITVPVGTVWQKFLRKYKQPVLHDRDKSHPSLAGTYLAACVFLTVLFKVSPIGNDAEVPGLDQKDRLLLEKFAWQSCKSKK